MLADTLPTLIRRAAARWPDRTFLRWSDKGRSLTFAEADAASDKAAAALAALGVRHGDPVGLLAHNGLNYIVAMLGSWKLGAISAHISVQVADQLADYASDCLPSVLVYTHDLQHAVEAARPLMPTVAHYVCMDGPMDGALGWGDLLAAAGAAPTANVGADDPFHLSFTSGSTGRPKAVVLMHGPTARATACIAERLGLTGDDASLGPTSPASSYGLVANLLPGIHIGMTVGLRSRWDVGAVFDDLNANAVTYLPANPILLSDVLQESRRRGAPPTSLRMVVSGGAAVPFDLKRAYFDELGIAFSESYGQSELGGFVALGRPVRESDERVRAVGQPLPDKEVAVLDDHGAEVPVGAPGELCIRGGVMWGYWGQPAKTGEAIHGGWLHTGDLGTMDADGYVSTLGRWSDRITRAGETIYPRPIEEALQSDARIRFAAVIAVPDATGDPEPIAIVELFETSTASVDALRAAYLETGGDDRLGRIELVDALPMTPTGKIDKIALRARFTSS